MKTCPACGKTYKDDTLVYCLDDGARLVDADAKPDADATLNLPVSPTIHAGAPRPPNPTVPNQATITAKPEHYQMPRAYGAAEAEPKPRSPLPWIFAIVLVLGISGVVAAWLLTRGGNDQAGSRTGEPTPFATPRSSPKASAEVVSTPRIHEPQPTFEVLDNMTLTGSRITYYPRESFAQCESDCSGNANCRGFAWVRPGAYNKGESAMCYLMSTVTGRVEHACCISAVRN